MSNPAMRTYPKNGFFAGFNYLIEGARLLLHPSLRVYLLIPLIVNCILFIGLTSYLLTHFWSIYNDSQSFFPESWQPWIAPFAWFVWFIVGALFLIIYSYSFNVLTNIIAAPFYGKLAEATEKLLTGEELPPEPLSRMITRALSREITKLLYFLGRGFLVILLMILVGLIPVIQVLAPLIGFTWGAWSMAIQYADYPADNNQVRFSSMRNLLWGRSRSSLGFGAAIVGCSVIPIVNIFCMPAAVVGGTIYWVNELKPNTAEQER